MTSHASSGQEALLKTINNTQTEGLRASGDANGDVVKTR